MGQSAEQKFLLIFSETKQKTKIDKYKASLKAIKYDSSVELKDDFKISDVFLKDFSDGHFESCQKRDSIYLTFNYSNDSFNIDNKYGEANRKKIDEILKNKKKLFSVNVKSKKIIQSKIDYYYVLIKCTACSGILDNISASKNNNDSVLLIKNNIEEIPNFEIDNVSAYKIYKSLIKH
ncbi:MAG: hypothetical protein BGO42_04935 [Flavobacterium sp. 40-81]|nr:MAG: hypothetical protein BGO42_04935 [Flavobacterium sp. 40-81]